jgi:hypothetical protein
MPRLAPFSRTRGSAAVQCWPGRGIDGHLCPPRSRTRDGEPGSHMTRWWREMDSNHRSLSGSRWLPGYDALEIDRLLGRFIPQRRRRLCRRNRRIHRGVSSIGEDNPSQRHLDSALFAVLPKTRDDGINGGGEGDATAGRRFATSGSRKAGAHPATGCSFNAPATAGVAARNRRFESIPLQRGVSCEPDSSAQILEKARLQWRAWSGVPVPASRSSAR